MAKARRSLPKDQAVQRQTGKLEIYAYEIKDAAFGVFRVLNTANGWWLDKRKVEKLIDAYKIDCTDTRACFYAGIRKHQLDYFIELHPEFSEIRELLLESLGFMAQQQVATEVAKNPAAALAYLKHKEELAKRREEDKKKRDAERDGEPANEIVFVDFSDPENALPAGKENDEHAASE